MKEITIRREKEKINRLVSYKVVVEDGPTILIGNGETKKVYVDKVPTKVYAKLNWLKSKEVTIDATTSELIIKGERIKNWFAPRMVGVFILITLLPRMIWDESSIAKTFSIVGLSILLAWTIYAFLIKNDDWLLIEKGR
jgi:Pyruvate/2-oxoacid:ferredoxin oxidoreductase gamma subunit